MSLLAPAGAYTHHQQQQIHPPTLNLENNSTTNELPIFEESLSSFMPNFLAAHLTDNSSSNSHLEEKDQSEVNVQHSKHHHNESLNNGPSDGLTNMSLLEMPINNTDSLFGSSANLMVIGLEGQQQQDKQATVLGMGAFSSVNHKSNGRSFGASEYENLFRLLVN